MDPTADHHNHIYPDDHDHFDDNDQNDGDYDDTDQDDSDYNDHAQDIMIAARLRGGMVHAHAVPLALGPLPVTYNSPLMERYGLGSRLSPSRQLGGDPDVRPPLRSGAGGADSEQRPPLQKRS